MANRLADKFLVRKLAAQKLLAHSRLAGRRAAGKLLWSSAAAIALVLGSSVNAPGMADAVDLGRSQAVLTKQSALQQGRAVVSGDNGQYTGRILVNAPISTVWAVLTDYNNFGRFMPNVDSSRLLRSNGNQHVFEQINVVHVFPITHRTEVVIATSESYPNQISFQAIDGDIESLQGSWQLSQVSSSQVMITHNVAVDPGSSNRNLFFSLYRSGLQDTLTALKRESERRSR
ncbi:MAG TPA: SRPBCC family protein [Chroococcidiopsis sp.]